MLLLNDLRLNWLTIGSLVNFSTSFVLGIFVFFKNRKGGVNRTFALMSFFVALWAFSLFIYCSSGIDKETSLFWARVCNLAAIFIPVTYLHFILELIGQAKKRKIMVKVFYALNSALFLLAMIFPKEFVGNVKAKVPGLPDAFYADKPGIFYHIFALSFTAYVLYFVLLMFNARKNVSGIKRNQLKYNIVSTLVGFGGGGTTFLLVYDIPFTPYPNILMNLWTVILAVAIIRYKLFEIETVVHRTALWLITSLWLVIPSYFLFRLTRYWLESLSTLWLTISALGFFYLFLGYYRYFQPRIDHLFRRRKYDYQAVLAKVAEKISTTINIKDLARELLNQTCEAMYLRSGVLYLLDKEETKYSLIGRRRHNEIELVSEEEKITSGSRLFKWFSENRDVLEKEQLEINPKFEEIKNEASKLFFDKELELIVPLVLENKVNSLLGLGKKENLKIYTLKDIELLKKLGQEAGVTIYNALHYRDLLLYFQYKPKDRTIVYSSAGHEHILIYRASSQVEAIMSGGFILGMLQDISSYLEEKNITLGPKDKVLLYTDGVTDAENTEGERFGLDRLKDSFKTNAGLAPFEMIHAIKTEVYQFIGTQPQYDDITLVGMEARE